MGSPTQNIKFMDSGTNLATSFVAPGTAVTYQAKGGSFVTTFKGKAPNTTWDLIIADNAAGNDGLILSY